MDVDALIKKIDYLVKIHPEAICSTLEKSGKTKVSYKTIPKKQLRADLIKLGADEIERLYNGNQLCLPINFVPLFLQNQGLKWPVLNVHWQSSL